MDAVTQEQEIQTLVEFLKLIKDGEFRKSVKKAKELILPEKREIENIASDLVSLKKNALKAMNNSIDKIEDLEDVIADEGGDADDLIDGIEKVQKLFAKDEFARANSLAVDIDEKLTKLDRKIAKMAKTQSIEGYIGEILYIVYHKASEAVDKYQKELDEQREKADKVVEEMLKQEEVVVEKPQDKLTPRAQFEIGNPRMYKNQELVDNQGSNLEIWKWETGDKSRNPNQEGLTIFRGKSKKTSYHYLISEPRRTQTIQEWIDNNKAQEESKKKQRQERNRPHNVKVGEFFVSSWGYDQTNVNFYQVIEAKGTMVVVREVSTKIVGSTQTENQVVPNKNDFIDGKMRKKVNMSYDSPSIKIDSSETGRLWDGKPKRETAWGYGH